MEKIKITEKQCEEILNEYSSCFKLLADDINPSHHRWCTYCDFIVKRLSDDKFFMGTWAFGNTEFQDNEYPEQELEECEEVETVVKQWQVKED